MMLLLKCMLLLMLSDLSTKQTLISIFRGGAPGSILIGSNTSRIKELIQVASNLPQGTSYSTGCRIKGKRHWFFEFAPKCCAFGWSLSASMLIKVEWNYFQDNAGPSAGTILPGAICPSRCVRIVSTFLMTSVNEFTDIKHSFISLNRTHLLIDLVWP